MKKSFVLLFLFINATFTFAGDIFTAARVEYISRYKDDAVRDMIKTGVPASITMAQACLESQNGLSKLATEANNHFGIKCSDWSGPTFTQDDDQKDECFRKYISVLESYDDHSNFLRSRPRYASLFQLPITDYKNWAKGLKKAGYATDPSYADRLIKIIEDFQLNQLDEGKDIEVIPIASVPQKIDDKPPVYASVSRLKEGRKIFVPSVDVIDPFASRKVADINGIDYIIAREGDTWKSLAQEFSLGYWQLPKYNESSDNTPLSPGQIVFLKPKKKDNADKYYISHQGEDLYSISQQTGVKIKYLLKYNNLQESDRIEPGRKILLGKS